MPTLPYVKILSLEGQIVAFHPPSSLRQPKAIPLSAEVIRASSQVFVLRSALR